MAKTKGQSMRTSEFRRWVHEIWRRNCDEHDEVNENRYTQKQYFQMYKYWLKREFQFQRTK